VPGSVARLAPESFRYGGKCLQKFIYLVRVNAVQIYENEGTCIFFQLLLFIICCTKAAAIQK
jgi:hypothetical protein